MIEIKHQPQRGVPYPQISMAIVRSCNAMPYRPITTCNCIFVCNHCILVTLYPPVFSLFQYGSSNQAILLSTPVPRRCLEWWGINTPSSDEWTIGLGIGLLAQRAQRPGFFSQHHVNWLWRCTSVTPAPWRRKQKDQKFRAILGLYKIVQASPEYMRLFLQKGGKNPKTLNG